MNPLVAASAISAGGSILGGLLGKSDVSTQGPWDRRPNKFEQEQWDFQKDLATRQTQIRVEDAKAAGIHPLYALGQSSSVSPVNVIPGQQTVTGSSLGRGIAEAGRQVGNLVGQKALIASQIESNAASANRDNAAAALSMSTLKRAEQEVPIRQDQDVMLENAMRQAGFNSRPHKTTPLERLHKQVYNPLTKKREWIPNQETGVELPEAYGALLLFEGELYDQTGHKLTNKQIQHLKKTHPKALGKFRNNWGGAM